MRKRRLRGIVPALYVRAAEVPRVLKGVAVRSEGQALVEYALILSLIAVVAITSLSLTGTNVTKLLQKVAGDV